MTFNKITSDRIQKIKPGKNTNPGLRASGMWANSPMIGWFMFVFGSLMFAALTYNLLAQGPLLAWDQSLANTLPVIALQSPPYVHGLMNAGFYLGKEVVMVADILLAFYFIRKKYWTELAMVTIGWTGSTFLFFTLSHLIGRSRPPTQIWMNIHIPGFPSGHAIASVTFYGLLAYLLTPKMPSVIWKAIVVLATLFIINFIGFSRIFTGGHYLTDILAGYAVGIAWCGIAYMLIETYFQKRRS